jgi:adenylate cyclase
MVLDRRAALIESGAMSSFLVHFGQKFDDAETEQAFIDRYSKLYFRYAQFSLGLAILLLIGDYLIDFFAFPELKSNIYRLLIGVPILIVPLLYTLSRGYRRRWQMVMSVFIVIISAFLYGILYAVDSEGGAGLRSWVGVLNFTFVEFFCFVILGIQFRFALWAGLVGLAGFLAAMYVSFEADVPLFLYYAYHVVTLFVLAALIGWWRESLIRKEFAAWIETEEEKKRSESILESILPSHIVQKLKSGERRIVEAYGEVSIIFSDLSGFTALAGSLGPQHLVEVLDNIFTEFDHICDRLGIEKIKTIGDSYMAVAGMNARSPDHAASALLAGREMVKFLKDFARREGLPIGIRVGIHTGPAIGGVLGESRPQFDMWGDTVNIASRMESSGEEGRIQVSESTWFRLQRKFSFTPRGNIDIKGKGMVPAYLHDPVTSVTLQQVG